MRPTSTSASRQRLRGGRACSTVHFVSPSIWAWRGGRVQTIARAVDHVLCLFPFEPEIYSAHGVAATYVGHPLADAIPLEPPRAASRAALGLGRRATWWSRCCPAAGAREIQLHRAGVPAGRAIAARQRPELRFVLPVAPGLRALVEPLVAQCARRAPIALLDGRRTRRWPPAT